jgi:hypothetical protein
VGPLPPSIREQIADAHRRLADLHDRKVLKATQAAVRAAEAAVSGTVSDTALCDRVREVYRQRYEAHPDARPTQAEVAPLLGYSDKRLLERALAKHCPGLWKSLMLSAPPSQEG